MLFAMMLMSVALLASMLDLWNMLDLLEAVQVVF
jgi:hypothetical protein